MAATAAATKTLVDLPDECLVRIALCLPVQSVARLAQTCRSLQRVCTDELLWWSLCCRDGMAISDDDPVADKPRETAPTLRRSGGAPHETYSTQLRRDRAWCDLGASSVLTANLNAPVSALAAHRHQPHLYVGTAYGDFAVLNLGYLNLGPNPVVLSVPRMHRGSISAIAYDKQLMVTAAFDGQVGLLRHSNTATFQLFPRIGKDDKVAIASAALDGSRVVCGRMDGCVAVWDTSTNRLAQWHPMAHRGGIPALQVQPRRRLVTGGEDGNVRLWVWRLHEGDRSASEEMPVYEEANLDTLPVDRNWTDGRLEGHWEPGRPISTHNGTIACMQLRGDILATGSYDGTIGIWQLTDNECRPLRALRGHSHHVNGLDFLERWQLIAGTEDGQLILWNWRTGTRIGVLVTHTTSIDCVALADGCAMAGCTDGTLVFWHPIGHHEQSWRCGSNFKFD